MITVGDVYQALDAFAPFSTQEKWDNSGLLVGRRRHGQGSFRLCSPADAFRSFRPIHHHHEYASAGVCGPHRS